LRKLEVENAKQKSQNYNLERDLTMQREKNKQLQAQLKLVNEDKDFFHRSALESKKKFKLCKVALQRVENEID
jgi:primosomal protein N''